MLMAGKNITGINDELVKISPEHLYNSIINSSDSLKNIIKQLQLVRTIDVNRYRKMKTMLPYFVCGIFNPPVRRTENFAWTQFFVIDIDHISEKGLSIELLKEQFKKDERINLMFVSPSNDGLKLMFKLTEKCFDAGKYSLFYKVFVKSFCMQYNLLQVVDNKTSDVTRACFLNFDANAWFNNNFISVGIEQFVNFENQVEIKELFAEIKQSEKNAENYNEPLKNTIDSDVLLQIKAKLNPKIKLKSEKIIFVPEQLEQIIKKIKEQVSTYNIEIKSINNINYGKKMVFVINNIWAEINIFYGKKGFSVVKTPKHGSNSELADIVQKILCELLL